MVKTSEGGDQAKTQRFEAIDVSDYGEEAFLRRTVSRGDVANLAAKLTRIGSSSRIRLRPSSKLKLPLAPSVSVAQMEHSRMCEADHNASSSRA